MIVVFLRLKISRRFRIGKGTAAVIQEYIESGTSEVLQELEKEVPSSLLPLLKLPGLGGKR